MTLLSVIITNYNYEAYIADAIESALAIDWPSVEVIVVDDGSTDGSRAVIESFYERGVVGLFYPNRGQAKAAEAAYHQCTGDWILFLDSDDMVRPSIIRDVVDQMKPGCSMISMQMEAVDASGRLLGRVFPQYPTNTTPELIRLWAGRNASYPTPPASGNLLSRQFLDKIVPLEEGMDNFIDSYFLSTAPFLGDVRSVARPLVLYRIHGRNDGAQSVLDMSRLSRDLGRNMRRLEYGARMAAKHGMLLAPQRWRHGFYNLSMRVSSLRLMPESHPIAGDSIGRCLGDIVTAATRRQGMAPLRQTGMTLWLLAVAIAPKAFAEKLVSWRFVPGSRPTLLQRSIDKS